MTITLIIIAAVIVYLCIGVYFSLIIGMVLSPESLSNPSGLPDWANFTIMILSGILWPVTLLTLIGFFVYNVVTGR